MHALKFLAAAAASALLAGNALAQCSNYSLTGAAGSVVLDADDALRTVGLPFAFPFNGLSVSSITISSNGWIKLNSPLTTTSSENTDTETAMLSGNARLAVLWDDLNSVTAGAIYYRADASQASITWQGVPHFGQAAALANCECVMLPTGDIYFYYDASSTYNLSTSSSIVGISRGNTGPALTAGTHLADWSTAATPINVVDATAYQLFTAATGTSPFDLTGGFVLHFAPTGVDTYTVSTTTLTACAPGGPFPPLATASTAVGTGCPAAVSNSSIYELFTVSTGTNPIDLANTSVLFSHSGNNFTTAQGPGLDLNYSTNGTLELLAGDDTLILYTLAAPFTYGTSLFTQVTLNCNGFLWLGNNTTSQLNASASTFHSSGPRIAGYWKDLVPNTTTAPIYIENTAAGFQATWQAVPHFPQASGGQQTFQITLNAVTGDITLSYGALTGTVTSSPPLVGISGGTPATDPLSSNLATATVVNTVGPRQVTGGYGPMVHTTTNAAIGQPFVMTTTNPSPNIGLGLWLIGATNPNLPLDFIFGPGSAPGCTLYSDGAIDLDPFFFYTPNAASFSKTIPVPYNTALAGITIFTQAGAWTNLNTAQVISSNGRTQVTGL